MVLTPAQAVRDLDQVVVPPTSNHMVARGLALDRVPLGVTGDGPWGLVDEGHRLLAVYEATETDRIRPGRGARGGRMTAVAASARGSRRTGSGRPGSNLPR